VLKLAFGAVHPRQIHPGWGTMIRDMSQIVRAQFEPQTVLDFTSPLGARVTAVRGSLITSIFGLLKETNRYDEVVELLHKEGRAQVIETLASSWISTEDLMAFFAVCEIILPTDSEVNQLGELLGERITHSLFAAFVRSLRIVGSDGSLWLSLRQADRLWHRLYQGGGVTIVQTGPKDIHHEVHGVPFAHSRYFRAAHVAFMRGMTMTMVKSCVIRPARARVAAPDRFAVAISWV
jgi:hypothetical protein